MSRRCARPGLPRLWLGTMLSRTRVAMTAFAISLRSTSSPGRPAAVGGIGAGGARPAAADHGAGRHPRPTGWPPALVLAVTVGQTAVSAALFALATSGGASLWPSTALVAAESALSAVNPGTADVHSPRLVPKEQLGTAMALNRIIFQVVMIAGPSLAGLIAAWTGLRGCYLADVASFGGALWSVGRLPAMAARGPRGSRAARTAGAMGRRRRRGRHSARGRRGQRGRRGRDRRRSGLALTLEGLAFIRRTPVLCGAFSRT